MKALFQIFFLLTIAFSCKAQDDIDFFLGNFQADVFNNQVLIRYTLNAGAVCTDLKIERADNHDDFKEVYRHFGVCGLTDRDANYHFVDEFPENGILYYRIVIYNHIKSTPIEVHIFKTDENQLIVYPNPAQDNVNIAFFNPKSLAFDYFIYNNSGNLVARGITKENNLSIAINQFKSGKYYFKLIGIHHTFDGHFLKP